MVCIVQSRLVCIVFKWHGLDISYGYLVAVFKFYQDSYIFEGSPIERLVTRVPKMVLVSQLGISTRGKRFNWALGHLWRCAEVWLAISWALDALNTRLVRRGTRGACTGVTLEISLANNGTGGSCFQTHTAFKLVDYVFVICQVSVHVNFYVSLTYWALTYHSDDKFCRIFALVSLPENTSNNYRRQYQ